MNFNISFLQRSQESASKKGSPVILKPQTYAKQISIAMNTSSAALLPVGRSAWIHMKVVPSRLRATVSCEVSYFLPCQDVVERVPLNVGIERPGFKLFAFSNETPNTQAQTMSLGMVDIN